MAINFFAFLNAAGGPHPFGRKLTAATAAAALLLLASAPLSSAALLPSGKDRSQGEALLQQANTAYQGGDFPGALHLLDQAEALRPDQADAWNLRGVIHLKEKGFDKAEAAFSRSVAIDPTLWAAQFNLGEVFFQQRNYGRARSAFDHLLAQTDRFKSANKWELVLYKAYLAALLSGDEADARKKMAKLPATGGVTPATQYAQAALAFSRKDAAGANKILIAAQTAYPPALTRLFSSSLETVGWQTPVANPLPGTQLASLDPTTAAAMNAAGVTNPEGLKLPTPGRTAGLRPSPSIDPRLIAAASDPLPSGPGRDANLGGGQSASSPVAKNAGSVTAKSPAAAPATVAVPVANPEPAATPPPSPFDRDGLLLGAD